MLDTSNYSPGDVTGRTRPDSAKRLKHAHEAAAYDTWFREEVQASIDDPRPNLPGEDVEAHFAKKRAALRKRIAEETT